MATSWSGWYWHLAGASLLAIGYAIALSGDCAFAQITPDGTLGAESSVVTPLDPDFPVDRIDGGAIRGANLFHSFREFNVDEGRGAYFRNPTGIENILSRVTGNVPSDILGTLGVLGNANLFLINPNGIIFGPNASLDIGGSFVATTANAVQLGDTGLFSASEPATSNLLTVNPSALFFNALSSQEIVNRSTATNTVLGSPTNGLQVPDGGSLLLVGDNVSVDGGIMLAPGGRVELGGVAGTGTVGLNVDGDNLSLSFPNGVDRANVTLTNGAEVNVRAGGGGSIGINAQNIDVLGASRLRAGIASGLGSVDTQAGDININATGDINITNESLIANAVLTGGVGSAGGINITTGSLSVTDGAIVNSSTFGKGNAGSVNINAHDTVSFDGVGSNGFSSMALSGVEAGAEGDGGAINIKTGSLFFTNGAQLLATTRGQGDAGSVAIIARDTVSFDGVGSNGEPSAAGSQVAAEAVGKGGSISITVGSLSVTNGAQLAADTFGRGDAGSVTITADDTVSFDGGYAYTTVDSEAEGKGGDINITARSLSVTNGAELSASTSGRGDGGSVTINAHDMVSFDGVSSDDVLHSGAFSTATPTAMGKGGDINITSRSLSVTNGAVLVTMTGGQGDAGSITIKAHDTVSFDGDQFSEFWNATFRSGASSDVVYSETQGKGGDLNITAGSVSVINGASLTASTEGKGDAGNIRLNAANSVTLSGVSLNGYSSDLATSTVQGAGGQGGEITVNAAAFHIADGAVVNAQTLNNSKGGSVTINANTLEATEGGQVLTTTLSGGKAGNITLNVTDSVALSGSDPSYADRLARFGRDIVANKGAASGLFANTAAESTGDGGNITIDPIQLTITDGAGVAVDSQGKGNAGNLLVQAGYVTLDREAFLSAATASGEGGNMTLLVQNLLLLRRDSEISAEAGGTGNGGDITTNTDLLVALENSDITANAFEGRGGNVQINTQGLFLSPDSKITASSARGINGVVEVNTPDVDPSQGLVANPAEVVDVSGLIAQTCPAGGGQGQSKFIVTGRGGLPDNPSDTLSSDAVEVDLVTLNPKVENRSSPSVSTLATSLTSGPIVEAQAWTIGANGSVVLTASAPTVTPHSPGLTPESCHTPQSAPKH